MIFLKKCQPNKHFWNLNLKLSHVCRKALGNILNCSSACPEVHISIFSMKNYNLTFLSEWSDYFWSFDLQVSTIFFKKNRFNCHGKNLENSFFSKIISICVRFFQPEQKLSGHSVKKSSWLSKLHSTHLEVHFEEFWLSEEDFCFHFRTLRKKDSDFCSLKTPMLSELHSTNPKLLFRTFLWKNLILKVFSDFERNRFRPLKTLYAQNCSRI